MFALGLSHKPLGWHRLLHWVVRFLRREATRLGTPNGGEKRPSRTVSDSTFDLEI